jgi:hypothetical protein
MSALLLTGCRGGHCMPATLLAGNAFEGCRTSSRGHRARQLACRLRWRAYRSCLGVVVGATRARHFAGRCIAVFMSTLSTTVGSGHACIATWEQLAGGPVCERGILPCPRPLGRAICSMKEPSYHHTPDGRCAGWCIYLPWGKRWVGTYWVGISCFTHFFRAALGLVLPLKTFCDVDSVCWRRTSTSCGGLPALIWTACRERVRHAPDHQMGQHASPGGSGGAGTQAHVMGADQGQALVGVGVGVET